LPRNLLRGDDNLTVPVPRTANQSLKVSFNDGVYVLFGGSFANVSLAWQCSWLGRPK